MPKKLENMTVEELRKQAGKRDIAGRSRMRKDELVEALGSEKPKGELKPKAKRQAQPQVNPRKRKSYQIVNSPDDRPDRPGRTLITRSHEVIRRWAEDRGGAPATVGSGDEVRVLRFDFPGYGGRDLTPISWEAWFAVFDERNLNFIFQQKKRDGSESNFFILENPDREDG